MQIEEMVTEMEVYRRNEKREGDGEGERDRDRDQEGDREQQREREREREERVERERPHCGYMTCLPSAFIELILAGRRVEAEVERRRCAAVDVRQ
eukprot:3877340-Pleurochrysis_carterae.AAC.3